MPYRAQVQSDFSWRLGQRPDPNTSWRLVAEGVAVSLADAQAQMTSARSRDQAAKASREAAIIYDQTFPD